MEAPSIVKFEDLSVENKAIITAGKGWNGTSYVTPEVTITPEGEGYILSGSAMNVEVPATLEDKGDGFQTPAENDMATVTAPVTPEVVPEAPVAPEVTDAVATDVVSETPTVPEAPVAPEQASAPAEVTPEVVA